MVFVIYTYLSHVRFLSGTHIAFLVLLLKEISFGGRWLDSFYNCGNPLWGTKLLGCSTGEGFGDSKSPQVRNLRQKVVVIDVCYDRGISFLGGKRI